MSDVFKNNGGSPMLNANTAVQVTRGNGLVQMGRVGDFDWGKTDSLHDIVTWKFVDATESPETGCDNKTGPIKSDGGSSSYYKLTIKTKDGSFECETGDVIAAMVGDNFALGNAVKALRRIYQASLGMGKDGTDMDYDANKINYFVKDFIDRSKLK